MLGSGPFVSSFRELGIPIYFAGGVKYFPKKLPLKLYWLLIAPLTLIRITFFLVKSKPDVVISSLYQADILGMLSSKILGIKRRIIIQHDIIKFRKVIYLTKKIFAINFSTQIISISDTVKNFLIEYFKVKEDKIKTIYNGINFENFKKGGKQVWDFQNLTIGIIGRLEEIKGHKYALEALMNLKDKHNLSPSTLIAGDGALRNDLEKYVKDNNYDSMKFLGNISNIPDFLSKTDILIIPSLEEGFCLVALEGMVSGKIIIASDIQAIRELIKDGQNGLLFESKNSDSLLKILLKVLNDRNICEKIKQNTLSFIIESKKIFVIREVSNTYQNLLLN